MRWRGGVAAGDAVQVLLGVTGSGKTFTMAKVIERVQKPTLVIAHNKTLAAQLCAEFREFFPDSAVEYFVSYYDYYQPEAYIPASDTYIEKTVAINDEIDKLRHSATCALNERRDVIIVASVSCIYALGDPEEYLKLSLSLRRGHGAPARGGHAAAGGHPVPAQRHRLCARHVPRARRRAGRVPGQLVGQGAAHRVLRRRDRPHQRGQRAHRRDPVRPDARGDLPRLALRDRAGEAARGHGADRGGLRQARGGARGGRQDGGRRTACASARSTTWR